MKILRKLLSLFRKAQLDTDMAEEMRLHLELQAERNRAAGMSSEEARYAAQREFGNVASIQEKARDVRHWRWADDFLQDVRYGGRLLLKHPGFTLAAVTILALGIGANTAVFNLVQTLLFAPPTYARPGEIVRLQSQDSRDPKKLRDFSYPAYREIRADNDFMSDTLASALLVAGLGEKGDTRRVAAAAVSTNYFTVLGVRPAQGRGFLPDEETPGRASPVVIVSHAFWKKHRLDPALLGSTLLLNGRNFTVIGIMPEGFTGTTNLFFTELWLPLGAYDQLVGAGGTESGHRLSDPDRADLMILGRLKPGLTVSSAQPALGALGTKLAALYPVQQKEQQLTLAPPSRFASHGNDVAVAWVGFLLMGMAGIVLLVACLNLANMLLARGAARQKEIALRLAVGGGRARIVRQLLTEGLLLSLLGGAAGLLLAFWSSDLLSASLGRMIPIDLVWSGRLSPAVLGAAFGFCVVSVLVFGLGPALRLSRGDLMALLKEQATTTIRPRWKFLPRNPLVAVQIALSLALLTTAALFIRSAASAGAAETGLQAERVFLLEVDGDLGGLGPVQARQTYRRLGARLAGLPGVESAGAATDIPLSGADPEKQVQRAGEGQSVTSAKWNGVDADYFAAAGLPLLRGRTFSTTEAYEPASPPVVIVNERLAKLLWPDGEPLGRQLQLADDPTVSLEVIGVVPSTRHTLFESQPDAGIYLPLARGFQSHVFFHVKVGPPLAGDEAGTVDLLRRAVHEVDPALPVLSLKTFAAHLDHNIQIWIVRSGAAIFSAFGGLALCLAIVGVYGVVACSVAQRTREIGIRMALGARSTGVQRMIVGEGLVTLASGLVVGFLLALGIAKVVGSLLYRVGSFDPVALIVAPALLAFATLLACWLPARRAAKVDPVIALRAE